MWILPLKNIFYRNCPLTLTQPDNQTPSHMYMFDNHIDLWSVHHWYSCFCFWFVSIFAVLSIFYFSCIFWDQTFLMWSDRSFLWPPAFHSLWKFLLQNMMTVVCDIFCLLNNELDHSIDCCTLFFLQICQLILKMFWYLNRFLPSKWG